MIHYGGVLMNTVRCVPKKTGNTASRVVDNEAVVVSPQEGVVRILNDVGSRVWELINGENSTDFIVDKIKEEFNAEHNAVAMDVLVFLRDLESKGMVSFNA